MAENEVVRTIRVRGVPEGLENLTSQLQRAEQAYSGVGAAASTAGTATETSARKLNTTERAYRSLTERLDSTARVYRQLQVDTRTLSGAFDAGFMGKGAEAAARFNSELLQIRQTLQDVGGRMATGNAGLDKMFGIGAAPGKSARESADVWEEQGRSLQKLRQQYDPLGVAQERYADAVEQTNKLLASGQISESQHLTIATNARKVLEDTTKAYAGAFTAQNKYGTGAGLARHELINLSRQIQDVGVSLASGQSPLTVLIQQGTQIADVFAASRASMGGFFAQAARGVAGFAMSGAGLLTGGALLGAGAAVAGYQYAESQREIERAMMGVGRQSGITTAQIIRMSDAYADAARVSTAAGREMLATFAGTGKIGAGLLPQTASLTRDFAAQFSLSASAAAMQLAGAFVDPTKGAQELNKQLGFLDARTLEYIRTVQAQGRLGDAQKALADSLGQSVQGAADRTSGLAKAWNAVWNAASGAWDAIGKAVAGQTTAEERLNALIERRRNMEGGLRSRTASGQATMGRLDDQIAYAQEEIRIAGRLAAQEAAAARARAASLPALAALDELNPFGAELRRLETMASALKKGLDEASQALNPEQAQQVREAYERVTVAIQAALTPVERQRQANALTVAAINARTLAERTSAEVARLQLDSAFRLKETEEQRLIILGKIAEMQAQANREARDALRSARDQSELAGLRPYERRLREIQFRERDNLERFGGAAVGTGTPATATVISGMDGAFSESLRRMMEAIPGISISSGFRSTERQAALWAEALRKYGSEAEARKWVAPPGGSQHERGMAADLRYASPSVRAQAHRRAGEFGLTFPLRNENWHVEPIGGRNRAAATGNAAASSISELERSAAATEAYNSIIRNANDNLAAQQAQLRAQRDTLFMSNEEIAKAQKFQELYNQAVQEGGVALAERLRPAIEQTAAGYGNLARQTEELQRAQEAMKTIGDLGRSVISGMVSDLRNGATGADMFRNALDKIASKLLDMALNDLFGKAFGNSGTGLFGGGGFLSSLFRGLGGLGGGFNFNGSGGAFSFGAGGYQGQGPFFDVGGFTGAGGKHDPAGIVHRGEYVFSAASVNRIGLDNLDAMHRGALRGYAEGGYVAPMPYVHPQASNSNGAGKVNVQIVNQTGTAVQGEAEQTRRPDGSIDMVVRLVEDRIGQNIVHGKGSVNTAMQAASTGQRLRG